MRRLARALLDAQASILEADESVATARQQAAQASTWMRDAETRARLA